MVTRRSTIEAFLRELETQLPIDNAKIGSHLKELLNTVIPVVNLADYDPDSNTGPTGGADTSFSEFGNLIAAEAGTATLTSSGSQTHRYILDTTGVPAGQVMVYRWMSMFCNAAVAEDFSAVMTGFGIGALGLLAYNFRVEAGTSGQTPIIGHNTAPSGTGTNDPSFGLGPQILYPGQVMTISSLTGIADGSITRLDFIRERYSTGLTVADRSAAISAAAI